MNEAPSASEEPNPGEENDPVCAVCLDGEVYEGNEILFCDKCNVAVHQYCYMIEEVPDGAWFCDPCNAKLDPSTLTCELCCNKGGAYKALDKAGKWVHSLCYMWIPEIFVISEKVITLRSLDKKRFHLKCALCKSKGAAIQCNYGRCTTAAHPWCVLHVPLGFQRRVIKDDEGSPVWEIFCKSHSFAVKEPYKPKNRPKSQQSSSTTAASANADFDDDEEFVKKPSGGGGRRSIESSGGGGASSSSGRGGGLGGISMAHQFLFDSIHSNKKKSGVMAAEEEEDEELFETEEQESGSSVSGVNQRKGGKSVSLAKSTHHASEREDDPSMSTFPILSLTEWPGQTEGEAMDVDHFWNYVSTMHPEDHSPQWTAFMAAPLLNIEASSLTPQVCLPCASKENNNPKTTSSRVSLEEKLNTFGSDKDRFNMFDSSKRSLLLSSAQSRVADLQALVQKLASLRQNPLDRSEFSQQLLAIVDEATPTEESSFAELFASSSNSSSINETSSLGNASSFGVPALPRFKPVASLLSDEEFFPVEEEGSDDEANEESAREEVVKVDHFRGSGPVHLNVAMEGQSGERLGFQLAVHPPLIPKSLSVDNDGTANPLLDQICKKIIGPQDAPVSVSQDVDLASPQISLVAFKRIPPTSRVQLTNRFVIPKVDDNIINRTIRTDEVALEKIVLALNSTFEELAELNLTQLSQEHGKLRKEWNAAEVLYQQQRVWKKIASTAFQGMRDHSSDFNKNVAEVIPASWTIAVDGRPKAAVAEDEEAQEDAVCMVCFDGSSNDNNRILFCDGCNAPLHQSCYGVAEIPEGDFYCDRCRTVQALASDDLLDIIGAKDAVKCCLCPCYHGGLKPTTDGRWTHLCCAMWAEGSVFPDLTDLSSVDVVEVPVQIYSAAPSAKQQTKSKRGEPVSEPTEGEPYVIMEGHKIRRSSISEPCTFCGVFGGYVHRCAGSCEDGGDKATCSTVFHPLCAWFHGMYIDTTISDPTFQGRTRGGVFPSGLSFSFCCAKHAPAEFRAETLRHAQMLLRRKYRINEGDLEVIPGKGTKRRRKRKPGRPSTGTSGRGTGGQQQKDLNADVYGSNTCAFCLLPCELSQPESSVSSPRVESTEEKQATIHGQDATDAKYANPTVCQVSDAPPSVKEENKDSSTSSCPQSANAGHVVHSNTLTCMNCVISVHKRCLEKFHIEVPPPPEPGKPMEWLCESCSRSVSDPRCMLCPRRGGAFVRTSEGNFCHPFCALRCPGNVKIKEDGIVEIRTILKDNRKQKCVICNRKNGVCSRCSIIGCTAFFHALCGERSGKAYSAPRQGLQYAYCSNHIPDGVERQPSGLWVDGTELSRLRYNLDRSRLILDTICRREKLKRQLSKIEGEAFSVLFNKLMDRGQGRRSGEPTAGVDTSLLYDSESEYGVDSDYGLDESLLLLPESTTADTSLGKKKPVATKPQKVYQEVPFQTAWSEPVELMISDSWVKRKEVKLPKHLAFNFAGVSINRYDPVFISARTDKEYTRALRERIQSTVLAFRSRVTLISSDKESIDFYKNFPEQLTKSLTAPVARDKDSTRKKAGKVKLEAEANGKELEESSAQDQPSRANKRGRPSAASGADEGKKLKLSELTDEAKSSKDKGNREKPIVGTPSLKRKSIGTNLDSKEETFNDREKRQRSREQAKEFAQFEEFAKEKVEEKSPRKLKDAANAVSTEAKDTEEDLSACRVLDSFSRYAAARAHPPYLAPMAIKEALSNSPHASLFQGLTDSFAAIRKRSFLASLAAARLTLPSSTGKIDDASNCVKDWLVVSNDQELIDLERRMMDILDALDLHQVPLDQPNTISGEQNTSRGRNGKKSSGSANQQSTRGLADDFTEIPYDDVPDYDEFVRRPLCLKSIRDRLQERGYRSMSAFSKDIYSMLNNAKYVTGEPTQICSDATALAMVFEDLKMQSENKCLVPVRPATESYAAELVATLRSKSDAKKRICASCACCRRKYWVSGWPADAPLPSSCQVDVAALLGELTHRSFDVSTEYSWASWLLALTPENPSFIEQLTSSTPVAEQKSQWKQAVEAAFASGWLESAVGSVEKSSCSLCPSAEGNDDMVDMVVSGVDDAQGGEAAEENVIAVKEEHSPTEASNNGIVAKSLLIGLDAANIVTGRRRRVPTTTTTTPLATNVVSSASPRSRSANGQLSSDLEWCWLCPSCISRLSPASMNHRRIQVWWCDDHAIYSGSIRGCDSVTGRYRVLYDDEQWEFLSLSAEPVLLQCRKLEFVDIGGVA